MDQPHISIRPATPQDVDVIAAITKAAYTKWISRIGREPLPMTVDYKAAFLKHRFDLAISEGEIVGLIETVPADTHLFIENLAISPDHQRKGIGKILLHHAEHLATAAGQSKLRLITNEWFDGNVTFYERHGFVVTGRETINNGVKVDMAKRV
ncbi:MAG: GNAT family N-acetyltransferase [Henriciella sp.]|nr:GNAT family N-acetyltransferase [Henriciella sp.]